MEFASPQRLVWLAVAIPIVVLYVLRTRLRKQPVSTLLFWDQLFDEKRQRSLWQRLRHLLSLLLQLAFLALLVGAIVDPLWRGQRQQTKQVVIVLDNSASMAATELGGVSRFEQAKAKALQSINSLRDGDEVALVTAGSNVRVVVGMTDFVPAIREAINQLAVTDGPTKVAEAIATAKRLTRSPDRRLIVVFSDLCFDSANEFTADKDIQLIGIGGPLENIGIVSLAVRRSLVDPIGYATFVEVLNAGQSETKCRLSFELAGELVDVIPLTLAAGQRWQKTIVGASASGGVLTAALDVNDALATDNLARAVLPSRPRIPVTLVTQTPSLYLVSVLRAIPQVDLTVTTTPPSESPAGGFIVLNHIAAPSLPSGAVLVIDPQSDCDLWKLGSEIEDPIVAKQDSSSPLLPHVQLVNVALPGARSLELDESASRLLVDASGASLLATVVRDQDRVVVLAADLDASDLPLRIAFPVLMTNAVNWFLQRTGEIQRALRTGEVVTIATTTSAAQSEADLAPQATQTVGPFDMVGLMPVYAEMTVAVNLCDAAETDLTPQLKNTEADVKFSGAGSRLPWFYLACLGLVFVVGEWFLYQRRIVG